MGLLPPRAIRWNFTVMGLDLSLFVFGLSFASWYGVLPLFVSHLTVSSLALGAIPALKSANSLPPLFVAAFTERLPRKQPFIVFVTIFERLPYLVLAIATPLLALSHPLWLLWLLFAMLAISSLTGGIASPAWLDLLARMLPPDWRGRFFGFGLALGGLFGIAGSAGAVLLLRNFAWQDAVALCFACTFVCMVASFVFIAIGREPAATPTEHAVRVARDRTSIWRRVPALLRENANLRWYMIAILLVTGATTATSFFTVDAKRTLQLSDGDASLYAVVLLAVSTVGNVLWGYVGDHYGHKRTVEIGAVFTGLAPILAVVSRNPDWGRIGYLLVFVLVGLGTSAQQLTALTFIMDFAPPDQRPTFVGLASTLLAPFAFGAPLLAAWFADWQGYPALFVVTAALGFAGALLVFRLVHDPRVPARSVLVPVDASP